MPDEDYIANITKIKINEGRPLKNVNFIEIPRKGFYIAVT